MDRFFSLFGKIILVVLVLGGLGYGGYYYGRNVGKPSPALDALPNEPAVQPSPEPIVEEEALLPTPVETRIIEGGAPKSAGLVFDLYTLEVPTDWSVDRESGLGSERLYIRKGEYELAIFQAATGGGLCLYPGDPDFPGPSARYDTFTTVTTKDARALRRSGSSQPGRSGKTGFTFCQPSAEGDYNLPTLYGHLTYSVPHGYDETVLTEMDRMASSLKAR